MKIEIQKQFNIDHLIENLSENLIKNMKKLEHEGFLKF